MFTARELPESFLKHVKSLEESYLSESDPIRQSGFGGGPHRWRQERKSILKAVVEDGDILDIGCANGHLLECLMKWAGEDGITLTPFGLDISERLVELARKRLPRYASHFFVGNAWNWLPPRRFKYVYSVYDCVPRDYLEEYTHRLLQRVVSWDGRLILGAYGSRSRGIDPFDLKGSLESRGFSATGLAEVGDPVVTRLVWIDSARNRLLPGSR